MNKPKMSFFKFTDKYYQPIHLLAGYGLPRPPAIFSFSLHALKNDAPLIYQSEEDRDFDFKAGILLKLSSVRNLAFLLYWLTFIASRMD